MKRLYVSTADFRAPFDPVQFQGLGQDPEGDPRWHRPAPPRRWPPGRSYWETALFRAPYRKGYYQDNSLFGLGATPATISIQDLQQAVGSARTGVLDPPTATAIARKQKQLGLPETGAPDFPLLVALGLAQVPSPSVSSTAAAVRDVRTAFNQVPRWAYVVAGGLLLVLGHKSYQKWKGQATT